MRHAGWRAALQPNRSALFRSADSFPGARLLAAINASTAYGAQLLVRSSNSPTKRSTEKLVLNAARSGVQGLLLVPPYAELLVGSAVLSEMKATAIAAAGPLPSYEPLCELIIGLRLES